MTEFTTLGLAEPLLQAITAEGYTTPTPIQAAAIPPTMEGRDIVAIAQTGTGKTAAFMLPLLHRLTGTRPPVRPKTCRVLVLAPTRELAAQIAEAARVLGGALRPRIAVVVGGVRPGPQIQAMARGVEILVATPGRLLDHMSTGAIRLDGTEVLVLDEADQMLDLGFMPAIRKVMAALPKPRQTLLFSATMPRDIRALATDFLTSPVEIAVTPIARPAERVEQRVLFVEQSQKRTRLVAELRDNGFDRTIIFTRTKHGADRLCRQLGEDGLAAVAIHGNKSQAQREKALQAFRNGRTRILVATDIAARGIDVDGVSHVVNYELPDVAEAYVHRIGRTARAGASGIAVSLVDGSELSSLRAIEKLTGQSIPSEGERPRESAPARRQGGRGAGGGGQGRPNGKPGNGGQPMSAHKKSSPGHKQSRANPRGESEQRRDQKSKGGGSSPWRNWAA